MSVTIARERPDTCDAIRLITELEALLEPLYPPESRHGFSVDKLLAEDVAFFLLRSDGSPAGCGGIQLVGSSTYAAHTRTDENGEPPFSPPLFSRRGAGGEVYFHGSVYGEIKRMYVRPEFRGSGFAKLMLQHLADYARSHNITVLRLETGIQQREAIELYERQGFYRIGPFGPYTDDPVSRCYEKRL